MSRKKTCCTVFIPAAKPGIVNYNTCFTLFLKLDGVNF